MSADLTADTTGYDIVGGEPQEIVARTLTVAGYLLAGATAFFFVAFLFAFFYLRSVDTAALWRPHGVNPSVGWGTAIVVCWVASAVLLRFGAVDQAAGRRSLWRRKGLAAFLLGVAGLVLQVLAWAEQGFGPTDYAYASVYVGWTAFLALFVLGTMFWIETALATSWRYRNEPFGAAVVPPGHASGDPGERAHDISNPVHVNTATVATTAFYWMFLAGIAVVSWVLLYLVA